MTLPVSDYTCELARPIKAMKRNETKLMALEFAQIEYRKRQLYGITIFSDSQSAVGILTLGWVATSHKKAVQDVQLLISDLEKSVKC